MISYDEDQELSQWETEWRCKMLEIFLINYIINNVAQYGTHIVYKYKLIKLVFSALWIDTFQSSFVGHPYSLTWFDSLYSYEKMLSC
jgi:hypothetical protein